MGFITILCLLAVYESPLPNDILHEYFIRTNHPSYFTTRFSIPLDFVKTETNLKQNPYFKSLYSPLTFNFYLHGDTSLVFLFYPRLHLSSQNWGVVIEPLFKTGEAPGWPYHEWEGFLYGAYSRAYAYYVKRPWMFLLGRTKLQLNLEGLFSEEDPPFDMFFVNYKKGLIHFAYWFGQFDPWYTKDSTHWYKPNRLYDRFISGHSLEFLFKNFSFSFSEVSLFFSRTNFPDLYFLNPFMIYHVRALDSNEGGEHNVFWILAGNLWLKRASLHGEFIVDDFQYRQVKFVPPKIAWIGEAYIVDFPLKNSISGLSYKGATRWTFTHGISLLYWRNREEVMGNFDENDFDEFKIFTRKHLSNKFDIKWEINYRRKGEASVKDLDPYWEPSDYPRSYFLTGVVEKTLGFANSFEIFADIYNVRVRVGGEYIWNHKHRKNSKATGFNISIYFSYRI